MFPSVTTIDLAKLASGDILSLQVYKFIGARPGKKVYIQANLHGAEIVGNEVIAKLIEYFFSLDESAIEGEIWLVPVCNPVGVNQRSHFFSTGRFNSYDGKNWNRIFWDYEKEDENLAEFAKQQLDLPSEVIRKNYLAKIWAAWQQEAAKMTKPSGVEYNHLYRYHLQSLCLDANYAIDIHSSSNQGIDYLYCFAGREDSAAYFLLERGILLNEYDGDAFDEAFMKPWLALERELAKLGREIRFEVESWTLELGSGMVMNPASVAKGVAGIENYLYRHQILKVPPDLASDSLTETKVKFTEKSEIQDYYATTGGAIANRVAIGAKVRRGDKLYQILSFNKQGELPNIVDVYAETDGLVYDASINYAVNQGEYVLGMMKDE